MKNKILLYAVLGAVMSVGQGGQPLAGMEAISTCPGTPPTTAPTAPSLVVVPDSGPVPNMPSSTEIIFGVCRSTGRYIAMGVNTSLRRFTFRIAGNKATQALALSKAQSLGIPVVQYTAPMVVTGTETSTAMIFNPCHDSGETGDPPPTGGDGPGGAGDWTSLQLTSFSHLAWKASFALDAVSHPVATEVPSPGLQ